MTSAEFSEWMAYYQVEPFGQWRDNWHSAQISALLFNVNSGDGRKLSADDFMYIDSSAAAEREDIEFLARLNSMSTRRKHG